MDFQPSDRSEALRQRLENFMASEILPAEPVYAEQRRQLASDGSTHGLPPIIDVLKSKAKKLGLWNLFLPSVSGLDNRDYAPLAEITGRSPVIAPEVLNCAAPDTGNMELLHMFATSAQKAKWLEPLLAGEIRSAYAMTEPGVASSDANNISTTLARDGDELVINGRKWWISGAADARCKILIVMVKSDPDAGPHRQQSMVLVPTDAPGVTIARSLSVFGYEDQHGHCEIVFDNVRLPVENLIGELGDGFAIAQARLGPGRIHHAMRAIGMGERALQLLCERAMSREAFGSTFADKGVVQELIAESRLDLEQARLLVMKTAWLIDCYGTRDARSEIAAIKIAAPRAALRVIDRAIEVHGAAGVSADFPLAELWARARTLRIVDGPDAVHARTLARSELARHGYRSTVAV